MKISILISYAYRASINWDLVKELSPRIDLLIDSGAYTAHTQGKAVERKEYQDWLSNLGIPCKYFQLDVIGSPRETNANYCAMLADGFSPIPIFTRGGPVELLDKMISSSDIIALGGISLKANNSPGYVKWFMRELALRTKSTNLHWLGFAERDFVLFYKPYSVDSSEWSAASRFKRLLIYRMGRIVVATKENWRNYRGDIEQLGFDPGPLKGEAAWYGSATTSYAQKISTASYLKYVRALNDRAGTKMHMVVVKNAELQSIAEALQ